MTIEPVGKDWIIPDWLAPASIRACSTTRNGGISRPPYADFNLGDHVGDASDAVVENRSRLIKALNLPAEPAWLEQVHSDKVVAVDSMSASSVQADASFASSKNHVCVVMTADCLPVLFCDRAGTQIAAAHAGWRGLAAGVLENTLTTFTCRPEEVLVWLGPAIGPQAFEVGEDVVSCFVNANGQAISAFKQVDESHWLADIYLLAKQRLLQAGVSHIYGGGLCTYSDSKRFYSFRRDRQTGRMASLIWFANTSA